MCLCNWLNPKDHCKDCACKLLAKSGPGWYRILLKGDEFLTVGLNQEFWFSGVIDKNGCALFYYWLPAGSGFELNELFLDCDCICGLSKVVPIPPPPTPGDCGCRTSRQSGMNFNITRGNGANFTTIMVNGTTLPRNRHGRINYNGHTCEGCRDDNEFTLTYSGSPGLSVPFVFEATNFNDIPSCPGGSVVITGTGEITFNDPTQPVPATFTLTLVDDMSISVTITATNFSFSATTTNIGNGQLVVRNCS
ncbi:MAG: hypothetical protein AB2374_03410 [Cytobacillus gottheilii]|uniref:hypothetical protein n=1 Tax=Cytobacillus gottheilii TaxID=859144 RepID=UPI0008302370|nr:hypothetical protein [Cytobacillus gottheilii]